MINNDTWQRLTQRLDAAGLAEKDFKEHFVRSSGKGGQNVNKVSTCVFLKHLPTSLEVKCQKTRSQADNRYFARELMLQKFLALNKKQKTEADFERYKIRKQKQRRSRRAQQKILDDKKQHSQKKNSRRNRSFHLPGSSD